MRFLLAVIFLLCTGGAYAAAGKHDDRQYVDWSQPPYNKIVYSFTHGATCTGQYVAKDIILTARHCITKNAQFDNFEKKGLRYVFLNNKYDIFSARVERYGRTYEKDDWALLRVIEPDYFSNEYFELSNPNDVPWTVRNKNNYINVMNAGFGYMRILSDKEIKQLRQIFKNIVGKHYDDANFNATAQKAREEIKKQGIAPLEDLDAEAPAKIYRLKASRNCLMSSVPVYYVDNCDIFSGNSGGPFFMNNQLFGIVSNSTNSFHREDYAEAIPTKQFFDALQEMVGQSGKENTSNVAVTDNDTNVDRDRESAPAMADLERDISDTGNKLSGDLKSLSTMDDIAFLDFLDRFTQYSVLQENLQQAKEREQSTTNKILGAVTMGLSGYGAGQYLAGTAEQNADAAAERDMRAYLETFRCDYGQGRNIRGGETNVELPLSGELATTYIEYISLANDLKERKTALGIKPGIEAELIADSASSGLYDNAGGAARGGVFASIARALQDPNGDDAARLAAQSAESKDKAKTGGYMFLGGNALGLVGNLLGDKLNNLLSNKGSSSGNGGNKNIAGQNSISGYFGALTGNGTASTGAAVNGASGGGTSGQSGATNATGEIGRAMTACNTLRADISSQAESLYNNILTVQSDAQAAGIDDASAIDAAVASAKTAKEAIETAQSAADAALANAQKLEQPQQEECELELEETAPIKGENDEGDDEESDEDFAKRKAQYERKLKAANDKLDKCKSQKKDKYNKEMQKWQADTKRYADEAERQLQIGRTELAKIKSALSNAESAKSRAIAAANAAAAKEAAEQKKEEEKQQQISQLAESATTAAQTARRHYDDARGLSAQADAEVMLSEAESAAEDQITALKTSIADDLETAKTAMENADKQIKTAQGADSVNDAKSAVRNAERYAATVEERKKAIDATLKKIKDAKAAARRKYEQEQAAAEKDSEESDENADEEED